MRQQASVFTIRFTPGHFKNTDSTLFEIKVIRYSLIDNKTSLIFYWTSN